MKTCSFFYFFFIFLLIACNRQEQKEEATKEGTLSITEPLSCYTYIHNNDTVLLSIKIDNNIVTGNLTYNFFEKDDNQGSINGEIFGDTIFAIYKFQSEGSESEREIAFLRRENTFVEGFGEVTYENEKMLFKNRNLVNFESNLILEKIPCQ
jgi:hypothetical protein